MKKLARVSSSSIGLLLALLCADMKAATLHIIPFKEISSENTIVIGALGVPLGEVCDVEGKLVPAREIWGADHMFNSAMLLKVEKVKGKLLPKAIYMRFYRQNTDIFMPEQIYKNIQTGRFENETESRKRWEAEYFGKRYNVLVVENGFFTGVPKNLPANCDIWSGPPYGFTTSLAILGADPKGSGCGN